MTEAYRDLKKELQRVSSAVNKIHKQQLRAEVEKDFPKYVELMAEASREGNSSLIIDLTEKSADYGSMLGEVLGLCNLESRAWSFPTMKDVQRRLTVSWYEEKNDD